MPKLVCCFESLNYIALNYSQSTTSEGFPTKAASVKKPFLYTNDIISRMFFKEHLNNIMLHLPGGHTVESKYIFKIIFSRKDVFLRALSRTKALPYWEGHLSGDQLATEFHQWDNAVPIHLYFKGNAMDILIEDGILLKTDGSWLHIKSYFMILHGDRNTGIVGFGRVCFISF